VLPQQIPDDGKPAKMSTEIQPMLNHCELDAKEYLAWAAREWDESDRPATRLSSSREQLVDRPVTLWNKDAQWAEAHLQGQIKKSIQFLLPEGTTLASLPADLAALVKRYGVADALAIHQQDRLRQESRFVIALACCGLISFELCHWASHLPHESSQLIAVALISLFVLVWCMALFRDNKALMGKIQDRFQDYRTLAEGLRVQFYWSWAGINQQAAESYPKRHRHEMAWIRYAIRQWTPATATPAADHKRVLETWIDDQLDYFIGKDRISGAVRENALKNKKYHERGNLFLISGIVLGGISAMVMILYALWHWQELHHLQYVLILFSGLCIIGAATCYAWRQRFAFAESARSYKAMSEIFLDAKDKLNSPSVAFDSILSDLGREALMESSEWLMLHRERQAISAHLG
jgi:hypothetical protein